MEENTGIRLNKYLSDAGICSRRGADALIAQGRVTVNGKAAVTGMRVAPGAVVCVDKKPVAPEDKLVVLAYNKPKGVVCTADKGEPENVYKYLNYPGQLKYIGRLDKMSEGLLLFTNKGSFADAVASAGNHHEKEYIVRVNKPVTPVFLKEMASGMTISIDGRDYLTRPCRTEKISAYSFRIVLTQGFNRQIRRMCQAAGFHVTAIKRVRVMCVELDGLKPGEHRLLNEREIGQLLSMLQKRQ